MRLLYTILFPFVVLLYLPFYAVHCIRRGGLTRDFWERFGIFPAETKKRLKALKAPVWIHAVSVGEAVEALSFIQAWRARDPQLEIVFSCGTSTGFATARQKLPPDVVAIYCPLDLWWMVWHALNLVHPRLLAILEVEIWPQLIRQTARRGIPVVLVNGRLSDRSSAGYARWGFVFRKIFRSFSALCMQTPEDRQRLERVIGPDKRIHTVGTVKFDQVPDRAGSNVVATLAEAFGPESHPVFCVGSTHEGEEEPICQAFVALQAAHPEWRMVLVPRHVERAAQVVKILEDCRLSWRSIRPVDGASPAAAGQASVLLANTTGQLMNFYQASDICFVGKSLDGQNGGHNIIEPAIFGKAILYGPHMENFRQVHDIFQQEKAALVLAGNHELPSALRKLAEDREMRETLGQNARATVEKHRGAIAKTLDIIESLPGQMG
ncbi:MAG: 3-deoxy-D-manno-octulosonic acid transferase [Victivallales bacterium]|nr:3-deoxy-D-manno-octulosonic acid transferase [Victivallales bacterium]